MVINNILIIARVLSIIFIFVLIFIEKRKPESTIAWILILTFLPYIGVFFYIMLGDIFHFNIHKNEREKFSSNNKYRKLLDQQVDFINSDDKLKKFSNITNLNLFIIAYTVY